MESQVDAIVGHCYKLIGDVARIRHLLDDKDTESLMHAIMSSRIDYCNSLFCGINKNLISTNMIQRTIIAQRLVCDGVSTALGKDSLETFQIKSY